MQNWKKGSDIQILKELGKNIGIWGEVPPMAKATYFQGNLEKFHR